ncbi:Autophagy protein 22 [Mortierella sp. GBA30]|nr:Autophagy protein 22 [Mortierella sp. GBA30]
MTNDATDLAQISKYQRLRRRLFYDDPSDDTILQPHIQERLTKKSELWGYFLFGSGYYSWANVSASLLLPIFLQGLARGAAHLESNGSVACPDRDSDIPEGDRCLVSFGWIQVTPTSYVLLANVVTVWCTIFVSLGVSAIADHGRVSKKIMLFLCTCLSLCGCLFFLGALKPDVWWFSGLVFVVAGIFFGTIVNFYDALIPILTRHHPDVVRTGIQFGESSNEYIDAKTKCQTFLSGGASAAGYAGGLVVTVVVAIVLLLTDATLLVVGYCVIIVSVFVFLLTCAFAKLSVQRTFPPLPPGSTIATYGYKRIAKTVRKARKLKTLFYFLGTWFILGDGLVASSNMAILIAQDQLQLRNDSLIIAALIQMVSAGLGMIFWIWIQNSRGMRPLRVVIVNSCLFGLIPSYCLLGLVPSSPIGLKQEWELYMLATFFGFFMAAIYSSNRVVYAQFIPFGHENELFALYEMSSVSSSWIAPLICTAIIERSNARQTWWFLATQFFVPAFLMLFIDVDKGRAEGIAFYENEQRKQRQHAEQEGLEGLTQPESGQHSFVFTFKRSHGPSDTLAQVCSHYLFESFDIFINNIGHVHHHILTQPIPKEFYLHGHYLRNLKTVKFGNWSYIEDSMAISADDCGANPKEQAEILGRYISSQTCPVLKELVLSEIHSIPWNSC